MSFLDGFKKGYQEKKEHAQFQKLANHLEDISPNYRKTAINNTPSNHGWYTCSHCGKKFRKHDMDADHIVPQKHGGMNHRENLQLLCAHCNRSKQDNTERTVKDLKRREQELKKLDRDVLNGFTKKRR